MAGPELSARSASPTFQASGSSSLTLNATEAKRRTTQDKKHLKRALSTIEKDSLRYKSSISKPWLDENGEVIWPQARIKVAQVVLSQSFETIMGLIIVANVLVMIVETDADATCHTPLAKNGTATPEYNMTSCASQSATILWLGIVNYLLLTVYTAECVLRAFVERGAYPWNRWNQVDLLTVISGWGATVLASTLPINVLRILRLIRLVRAARVVISVPEFYILVSGFTSSFKAILFGSVMLVCIIVVWSIIVVEVIHPVNVSIDYESCDHCNTKFQSVWSAMLTIFQQVVAGDSWGETSLPLVETDWRTILILFPIMMTISLGAMNLILAVIVERATEARENDQVRKAQKKDAERERSMVELALLCDSMDNDGSGTLSLEEMLNGFDINMHFKGLMEQMDITREDMETIFNVLDSNHSGEVDYVEFCQHLGNFRKRDQHMMPSLIKYSIMEIRQVIKRDIVQILEEHTEMLFDQLDVLSSVPVCMKKAEEVRIRRRSAPSLRRQGKSQGKPQFFGGTAESSGLAAAYAELPETVEDPSEMLDRLDVTCKTFQSMQDQLESMMSRAEELAVAALDSTQEPFAKRQRMVHWQDPETDASPESVPPALDLAQAEEIEAKCASVLQNLKDRMRSEELLQAKCHSIMRSLDTLINDPDCGLAIVRQALV
ncbi:Ca-alpha1D [Symbiodinium natans]|uniref:Ca-alpha1D protein n=1 Tax=Symbiodinium natans TaxID=878477 RepID=A0A812SBY6_9DINO|nr:Ca-alpha1D [Symbiodinium natans]